MTVAIRGLLAALHHSGLARLASHALGGAGAIFMLHRVLPEHEMPNGWSGFAPNAGLVVSPEFLDAAIAHVRERGFELIPLHEVPERLAHARAGREMPPFACFTLDDGYRDNHAHAWPVFHRHGCPFTIFVVPKYADGEGEPWWDILEHALREGESVAVPPMPDGADGLPEHMRLRGDADRQAAWETLYPRVRSMAEDAQRVWIRAFARANGIEPEELCHNLMMNWNELREIAADPLCAIGAHTNGHHALARLEERAARREMAISRDRIEAELDVSVQTLAYPYGDELSAGPREFRLAAELGFSVAVTTRKGLVYPEHAAHPHALPRLSLNGHYQRVEYLDALLSGLPFMLFNRFRRVNVA